MNRKLLTFLFLLYLLNLVQSKAILDAKNHLFQFGYLNSLEADEATLSDALKKYQKFLDLPATGNMDDNIAKNMERRRCGKPDSVPEFFSSVRKWKNNHLTYRIRNWTEPFTKSHLRNVFENAISLWTQNVDLQVTESKTGNSDIDIYFSKQDGRGVTLGYAYYPEHGDIFFDVEEFWVLTKPCQNGQTYFTAVAVHEMGHSLGLRHNNLKSSIMYPYYSPEVVEPTEIDKNNLKEIYGKRAQYDNSILCENPKVDGLLQTTSKQHILFQDNQYWTFTNEGLQTGPFLLDSIYPGLPENIDCAFSIDTQTYIFKDNIFYKYMPDKSYIKKLIAIGFDNLPSNIDAAFTHSARNVVYFFKGDIFYEFGFKKPREKRLNLDGKKISKVWVGVPNNVEAATMLDENIVLFIKKSQCYIVNLETKRVVSQKICTKMFLNC